MTKEEIKFSKKTDVFSLKTCHGYCGAYTFTVKRKKADIDDFGELEDIDEQHAPEWGCGNMCFTPKLPAQEVLDKYKISADEYKQITEALEEGFAYGCCSMCA